MPSPPSLVEISFETVLVNIQRIPSEALETLPEQFVTELFEGVLARGMLNEPIFDTFEFTSQYPSVNGAFLGIGAMKRRSA